MQPASGGYLEAIPLTSFVVMALAHIGRGSHPVARRGLEFLHQSQRADGSWPIDSNLSTWVTTLSALALANAQNKPLESPAIDWEWILNCQHRIRHPFTGAAPGGWGWSDLTGAVPDADDTPGALLALRAWHHQWGNRSGSDRALGQIRDGVRWLLALQNRDGGWPTFCRGWGTLPFDRSGSDLTAHAIRALIAWRQCSASVIDRAIHRGVAYLAREQRPDGSWLPLWFGNQDEVDEVNPVYGTSKVLMAYRDLGQEGGTPFRRGAQWLIQRQNVDGGWGGGRSVCWNSPRLGNSTVEETALATEALAAMVDDQAAQDAHRRGVQWLVSAVGGGFHKVANPIGFYFAKLWYYEELYPLIFTVSALGRAMQPPSS
jgi:squalene-hopene/tetraprenyl-beta-curcumene cyclase